MLKSKIKLCDIQPNTCTIKVSNLKSNELKIFVLDVQGDNGCTRPVQSLDFFNHQTLGMCNHLEISLILSRFHYLFHKNSKKTTIWIILCSLNQVLKSKLNVVVDPVCKILVRTIYYTPFFQILVLLHPQLSLDKECAMFLNKFSGSNIIIIVDFCEKYFYIPLILSLWSNLAHTAHTHL